MFITVLFFLPPADADPFTSWHATFVYFDKGQNDAQAMKNKFDSWKWTVGSETKGWETSILPSSQVTDAFKWLRDRSSETEISVFYFGGHSFTEEADENKIEESSTEDAPPSGSPKVDDKDEGIETTVGDGFFDDQIGDELRKIAGYTVSLFDSCFSGGMVDGTKDINGKKQDGTNKKNETVMMSSMEFECSLFRGTDERGVFTEYLLKNLPTGNPTVETFGTWFNTVGSDYLKDYKKNPGSFNNEFQTFKLTQYSNGTRTNTYCPIPEPTTMLLLCFGLVGLIGTRKKIKKNKYRT